MENLGRFVLDNWWLFLALIVILALLFVNLTRNRLLGFRDVKAAEAVQLINHDDAVVIDVRSDDDFEAGHIVGAVHAPLALLEERMKDLQAYRERKVIVCCEAGRQSAHAGAALRDAGFGSVYKLSGGLMAWRSAGLPLEKGKPAS